jgi:hypothetical protein
MSSPDWHIIVDLSGLTHARKLPVRFDVKVEAHFPKVSTARLAIQIRQDMWRELQSVRGFSPVVRVAVEAEGLLVTAGGRVEGRVFPKEKIEAQIADLLADAAYRERWLSYAGR